MDNKNLNFEIKEVNTDDNFYYIKGYASTADLDRADDIVIQNALLESVQRLGLPAFMHQHDMRSMPLGVCTGVTQEAGKTIVDLKMPKNDYTGKVKQLAEMGAYQGLSIGFICKKADWDDEKGIRIIKEVDWYEVSLVTVPCNQNAKLVSVKSQSGKEYDIMNDIKTIRDAENLFVDFGCTKKEAGYIISMIKSAQGDPNADEGKGEPSPDKKANNEADAEAKAKAEQEQKDLEALMQLRDVLKK